MSDGSEGPPLELRGLFEQPILISFSFKVVRDHSKFGMKRRLPSVYSTL